MRRSWQFARAAWFAARKSKKIPLFQVFRALLLAATGRVDRRPGSLWWKRLKRGCLRCPIYDRSLGTCGYVRNLESLLGCGCIMPLKAGLPEAQCWLWEQTGGEMGVDFQAMDG